MDEGAAEGIVGHPSEEGHPSSQTGHTGGGVGPRTPGSLGAGTHRCVDGLRTLIVDQDHGPLDQTQTGEIVVSGEGEHIDEGVAQHDHVQSGAGRSGVIGHGPNGSLKA